MTKSKKALSILLSVLMILSVLPLAGLTAFAADPENKDGYSIFVIYDGLDNDTAAYGQVRHDFIEEPYYVIPENPDTVKEDLIFNGFYCRNTGEMVQIGESVPITDFQEKEDGYYLYLSARFSQKEKPGVTYTDTAVYYVSVNVQQPDSPYGYLEDPDARYFGYDDAFEDLDGQDLGVITQPRQLMLYTRMGLNFMGLRSLLTGNVFEVGDTLDVDKLPEAVYVGQELEEISDTEGYRISVYEINDYVEILFEYLDTVGAYTDPLYECTINYYSPVAPKEDEGTTGDPLQFFAYEGSDVHTMSMFDLDTPMELTCQPDYMEDLGYVLDGYGAIDDDEITYPDGIIFMDQYTTNDNAGHLSYLVKLFYTEADEDATEEELLASAKVKVGAKYQEILDDASASDGEKAIASAVLAEIADAANREEMKAICRGAENDLRLQAAKDMAIAEVMTIAPEGKITDEMQAVIDKAAADIQASDDAAGFEDIITEARSEINSLLREIVNFEAAKEETIENIEALADENDSDAVKAIVADAAEAAANAKTYDELSDILLNAQADVVALREAEALAKAKEEAKKAIDAELKADDTDKVKAVAEEAKAAIDAATALDEVEAEKVEGIEAIKAARDTSSDDTDACPKCGGHHGNGFFDKIVCFFTRIIKMLLDAFNTVC